MKHVKQFEQFVNEKIVISPEAYQIHVNLATGQDATQYFIDDNNIDGEKLAKYVIQHRNSAEKYDVRDMINGTQPNPKLLKKFIKESQVTEEYGGPGKYEVPADHLAGMKVPKGGSSCASCEYWNANEEVCNNKYYQEWAGTNKIPYAADEYCTDWYEPKQKLE